MARTFIPFVELLTTSEMEKESFNYTDSEIEPLLECVKVFASNCSYEGKDWEGIKSKYDRIREIFIERYPQSSEVDEDFPKCSSLHSFTKERIAAKVKNIRKNFKKAVDLGKRSGGGKIVMTFYNLCCDIWAGAPATKCIEGEYAEVSQ